MKQITFLVLLFFSFQITKAQYETEFQQRSQLLINDLADTFLKTSAPPASTPSYSDPQKKWFPKAIARLEKYGVNDGITVNQTSNNNASIIIDLYKNDLPFHFTLVGMARIMCKYPTAPTMALNEKLYLQKVFERTDNYNAWASEGTENHINMSRTSGYLYAQMANKNYPTDFPDAAAKMALMKQWILDYSKAVYQNGTAEFNSKQYGTYNIIGWLNLYDFAEDADVKAAANAVLDYYAGEMALNWVQFTIAGPDMRSSKGADVNGEQASEYLGWLWFGQSTVAPPQVFSGEQIQSIHACTSTYRPPLSIVKIARKQISLPVWALNSKSSYLFEEKSATKQFYFADKGYVLSSCVTKYGGYSGASYAMMPWSLVVSRGKSTFPYVISGNGRSSANTKGRGINPFTQIVQYKNVLILMTKTPTNYAGIYKIFRDSCGIISGSSNTVDQNNPNGWAGKWQRDFFKRYPNGGFEGSSTKVPVSFLNINSTNTNDSYLSIPGVSTNQVGGKICVVDLDSVWMGVTYFNSNATFPSGSSRKTLTDASPGFGKMTGFVVEIAKKTEYANINAFYTSLNGRKAVVDVNAGHLSYNMADGTSLYAEYVSSGSFIEPIFDWGWGPQVPDTKMFAFQTQKFFQPNWSEIINSGRIPDFKINNVALDLSVSPGNEWSIFDSPVFQVKNNKLLIYEASILQYQVDYTGDIPVINGPLSGVNKLQTTSNEIKIFPIPAKDNVNVLFNNDFIGKVEVVVNTLTGIALLHKYDTKLQANQIFNINTSSLKSGVYIVDIGFGKERISKTFLKQ